VERALRRPRGGARLSVSSAAHVWLEEIRRLPLRGRVRVMNVCGGHERTISLAGLRGALPPEVELIPGPGCPVCVCPEEDVYAALQLAQRDGVCVATFGDMLRVPVNAPRGEARSLEDARAAGGDVQPVASPGEVARLAAEHPERAIVFFAAGFETTMAPVAALLAQDLPENVTLLLAGRLTWPAVAMLLESEAPGFDALLAPGHVATVMGPEQWRFVSERHGIPSAIAGFTADSLLAALYCVLRQHVEGRAELENCYPSAVRAGGNPRARATLEATLDVVDAPWRGIGTIPGSGFALRPALAARDARSVFALAEAPGRRRAGEMPPGCACARVVLGKIYPNECPLYGRACTPRRPIGPCMVSDEGACRIWWSSGIRESRAPEPAEEQPAP
jgi:hydrogenase expression/formation protein HypD